MKQVKEIFSQLQSTSSKLEKQGIIRENKDNEKFKDTLVFLLSPYVLTGISEKKINKKVEVVRRDRLMELKRIIKANEFENIEVVKMVYRGTDHSKIWEWLDEAERRDWEGLMINLDTPYECKRTKNLIKVKKFFDTDLRCISVNTATTGKYKGTLGSITCKYKNGTVDVGSGFSDEQRDYYFNHKDEIVGKIVTVKYKEITTNKNGGESLQFPVFVTVRQDKEVADDE